MAVRLRQRVATLSAGADRSIVVLALLAFISQVGVAIMLPLLPLYAVEIGATPSELGLMVGAFSVTTTVGQLAAGFLSGWIPARRQMPLGQAIYATGNFLIAATGSAVALIGFRALAGLGGGLTLIAERLYIARVTAQERLAFVNGVVSAAGASGSVIGPLLGAVLALQDLRTPFVVVASTATIAGVAALLFLPRERSTADAAGGSTAPRSASPDAPTGAVPRWLAAGRLARLALWSLAFNAAYGAWITTFGPFATIDLGHPPSVVALFFVPFGLGSIVFGPMLARHADRTGRRRMIVFGTLLVFVNVATLAIGAPVLLIYGSAVVAGGGLAAAQASWFALLGVATDGGRRGRSFGLVSALSNLGIIGGAAVASFAWETIGVREGLISAGVFLLLAAGSMALVPSDRPSRVDSEGSARTEPDRETGGTGA